MTSETAQAISLESVPDEGMSRGLTRALLSRARYLAPGAQFQIRLEDHAKITGPGRYQVVVELMVRRVEGRSGYLPVSAPPIVLEFREP